MTTKRPNLSPLALSERDRVLFGAHLEAAKTFIGSDAHFLPRSTNMRLPDGQNIASSIAPSLPWPTPPPTMASLAGPRRWHSFTHLTDEHDISAHATSSEAAYDHEHDYDLVTCTCGAALANQKIAELAAANAAAAEEAAAAAAAAAAAQRANMDEVSSIVSDLAEATEIQTAIGVRSDDASSMTGSTSAGEEDDEEAEEEEDFDMKAPPSPTTTVHSSKSPQSEPTKGLPAPPSGQNLPPSSSSNTTTQVTRGRQPRQSGKTGPLSRFTPASAAAVQGRFEEAGVKKQPRDKTPLPWEEDDVDEEEHTSAPRQPFPGQVTTHKTLGSSIPFLAAIPCLQVHDIASSLPFYKTILGFTVIGKPDISHAKLRRGDVTLYLRVPPLLPPGSEPPNNGRPGHRNIRHDVNGGFEPLREPVQPGSTWINVASADALFHEVLGRMKTSYASLDAALQLAALESYFPDVDEDRKRGRMGKILGRVENKPWGTREFAVQDADGNRVTFQQEIRR
ncbi:hypothetical protein OC846_000337 [Tilletia horrida]|uniref:Glyoxalase/fosfomycin resistance/dioxygenase domain-containing protein n=1 Tax=Tilletia horrida TaxID=155126 RepID=A0AAN6GVS8_9BASI|nr:hypothetical protein OC846_000337 [Tilletia horrida]